MNNNGDNKKPPLKRSRFNCKTDNNKQQKEKKYNFARFSNDEYYELLVSKITLTNEEKLKIFKRTECQHDDKNFWINIGEDMKMCQSPMGIILDKAKKNGAKSANIKNIRCAACLKSSVFYVTFISLFCNIYYSFNIFLSCFMSNSHSS